MKNQDLMELNATFGKLTLPEMGMDDLYAVLTQKNNIDEESKRIEARMLKFQEDTKPASAGEYEVKLSEPENREWWNKVLAMRSRLLQEESEIHVIACVPREAFAQMARGLTMNEAALVMRYLVKKEG